MSTIIICHLCRDPFYKGTNPIVLKEIAYDEGACPSCNGLAYIKTFHQPSFEHPRAPRDRHIE